MKLIKIVLLAILIAVCFLNQYRKNPIGTMTTIINYQPPQENYLATTEKGYDSFKKLMPAGKIIGYFGNNKIVADEGMSSDVVNYYLMQFFFAPIILDPDNEKSDYLFMNTDRNNRVAKLSITDDIY